MESVGGLVEDEDLRFFPLDGSLCAHTLVVTLFFTVESAFRNGSVVPLVGIDP